MKMKYLFSITLFFLLNPSRSQEPLLSSNQYPELRYAALKGEVFYSGYRQIKGNAYLTDDWITGTVYLKNGGVIPEVQFKFDTYAHCLLVYHDKLKRLVIPDKSDIDYFTFTEAGRNRTFISVNAELSSKKVLQQYFLEELSKGKIAFYKLYINSVLPLKTPEMPFIDEFIPKVDYYIFFNNRYEVAKLKKSYIIKKFPQYKRGIKKFTRENKLRLRREDDFAETISFLNILIDSSSD